MPMPPLIPHYIYCIYIYRCVASDVDILIFAFAFALASVLAFMSCWWWGLITLSGGGGGGVSVWGLRYTENRRLGSQKYWSHCDELNRNHSERSTCLKSLDRYSYKSSYEITSFFFTNTFKPILIAVAQNESQTFLSL